MNITIYTTSSDTWYREKAKNIEKAYAPYFPLTFTLIHIDEPKNIVFRIDSDGDKCFNWEWFNKTFPKIDGGVAFHFNKKYARKWGIKLGGQRDSNHKDVPYFWLTCDKEKAKGYDFSNFERLLFHEMSHHWEDLDNEYGNNLNQDSVHDADYNKKEIHKYHGKVDFLIEKKSLLQKQQEKLKALLLEQPAPFLKGQYRITQAFGVFNPIYTQTQHHLGTDFATPLGTLIYAPWEGTLTKSVGKETGIVATLETKYGTYQFLHLGHCAPDGHYTKGHIIGYTGNSGSKTTGPHVCVRKWKGKPDISVLTAQNFKNYLESVI